MYDIETNVEMGDLAHKRGRKPKYPFADLEVGQGFFVPLGKRKAESVQTTLCSRGTKVLGSGCVQTRSTTHNGVPGIRVKRIK